MENELEFLREFYRLYQEKQIQGEFVYPPKREELKRTLPIYERLKPIQDKLNEDLRQLKEEFKWHGDYHLSGIDCFHRWWTLGKKDIIELVATCHIVTPEQIKRYLEEEKGYHP